MVFITSLVRHTHDSYYGIVGKYNELLNSQSSCFTGRNLEFGVKLWLELEPDVDPGL